MVKREINWFDFAALEAVALPTQVEPLTEFINQVQLN